MKGKNNIKRLLLAAVCALMLSCLTACGESSEPVTLTLWHVYGGETNSPLNDLVDEFNATVGKENGIRVKVELVSNTNSIHESVLASAYDDPGASPLPDMFSSYPKTVLALPDQDILADYRDYFSQQELDAFIPEFLDEGTVGGRLNVLPVAKSTEVLFINKTAFDRFAAESGASIDDLRTWEGLYAMAEPYMQWSGGRCFFVHDYHFDYFQVGTEALGEDFFSGDGIAFGPMFERAWKPYADAALQGGVWLRGGYATEPLRTGDCIVSVASSASVLYYSDTVTYADNTSEKVEIISMPCPTFEGGEKLTMQRGAGICTVRSTPEREKACMVFLKWLTQAEKNTEFVTSLGYMPVTREGFEKYLPEAVKQLENPMYASLYETYMETQRDYSFYTAPQLDGYLELECKFEDTVRLKLLSGRARYAQADEADAGDIAAETLTELKRSFGK